MAKINLEYELVNNHSDEEIIEFLDGVMTGILKNYRTALTNNQPEVLWGNLGDITIAAGLVRGIKKRNMARQAQNGEL